MNRTIPTTSLLAQQLDELVQSGAVVLTPVPLNAFPSARIVVPVYESNGTHTPVPEKKADISWPTGTMY
ncbi:hypothetical protein FE249_19130 (plasmid) [Acidiphilium multivorum]|uniref:hypothetical protein n=1 Tax=Acidiphilium multivorum TaxID=62140 RepID=UPI001F4C35D1|nr:hypothetical protein [Acidiphilium multivorum]UNC16322.1 hypothetical protein FE249_19130 [Acidiphilium multivorum]